MVVIVVVVVFKKKYYEKNIRNEYKYTLEQGNAVRLSGRSKNLLYNFNHLFNNYPPFSTICACVCDCRCHCRFRSRCVYSNFPEVRRLKYSVDIDFYFWLITPNINVNKLKLFFRETQLQVKGYWTEDFFVLTNTELHSNLSDVCTRECTCISLNFLCILIIL